MSKLRTYRKTQCKCGAWVTTNALGRAAHLRSQEHADRVRTRSIWGAISQKRQPEGK